MSVEQVTLRTRRGDSVTVSLVIMAGEDPTLLVTLDDVDDSPVPTAELTIEESAQLREVMRKFAELAYAERTRRASWKRVTAH